MEEKQLKAAKMLIVGWIKDWSCVTTYHAISGNRYYIPSQAKEVFEEYPFLPSHWLWYTDRKGKVANKSIRRYVADLNKKLSDALWDTEDNMKKLEFAPYLAGLKSKDIEISRKYNREDANEYARTILSYRSKAIGDQELKEYHQKANGTHWKTVK